MLSTLPTPSKTRFARLEKSLAPDVRALLAHPLYAELRTIGDLRLFMECHVFAVWDFMSLVKALQIRLTSVKVPWMPPSQPRLARFINEIVLGEESDDLGGGLCLSHCDLYLRAMEDVGADPAIFRRFVSRLGAGRSPRGAFAGLRAPRPSRDFVLLTLETARLPAHRVAASFLYGRESVIPDMFRRILPEVERQGDARLEFLKIYLDRHIEVDGDRHAPLARELLVHLCGASESKWTQAEVTARRAIAARLALWDGVLEILRNERRRERPL